MVVLNFPLQLFVVGRLQRDRYDGMINGATHFNKPIGDWKVSKVKSMNGMRFMFGNATHFNQPIGDWNVSNVGVI